MARLLRLRPRHGPRITGEQVRDGLMIPRWALTLAILLTMLLFLALLVLFFLPADARASEADGINFDTLESVPVDFRRASEVADVIEVASDPA